MKQWALREIVPSQSASDFILKDDLFSKYKEKYPDVKREFFLAHFGRLMGIHPFHSVIPLQKKGKKIGFSFLRFNNNSSNDNNNSNDNKKVENKNNEKDVKKGQTKRKPEELQNQKSKVMKSDNPHLSSPVGYDNLGFGKSSCLPDTGFKHVDHDVLCKGSVENLTQPIDDNCELSSRVGGCSGLECGAVGSKVESNGSSKKLEPSVTPPADVIDSVENSSENADSGLSLVFGVAGCEVYGKGNSAKNCEIPETHPDVDVDSSDVRTDSDSSVPADYEFVGSDFESENAAMDSGDERRDNDSEVVGSDVDCEVSENACGVDTVKRWNFRKIESESSLFNSRLFFDNDLWKDPCKKMCASKLPGHPKSYDFFLDSLYKECIDEELLKTVRACKNQRLTKLRAFIAGCFKAPIVGTSGCHSYLQCDGPGGSYPQFSCSKGSSSITCEICVPYQKWAFENNVSHASLRSRGATLDKILSNSFTPSFSGLRQVYEHSVSKSHLKAIAFVECCEKSVKSDKSKEKQEKGLKQRSLDGFLLNKSDTVPLN